MKPLLFTLAIGLFNLGAHAAEAITLNEHMRTMGYLLDQVYAKSTNENQMPEAAKSVRSLRGRLVVAIGMVPAKISAMKDDERYDALIEYHQLMARAIYLTGTLERVLASREDHLEAQTRADEVRNLLHELSVVMGKGHVKFR